MDPKQSLIEYGAAALGNVLDSSQVAATLKWLDDRDSHDEGQLAGHEPEFDCSPDGKRRLRKLRRLFWNDPVFWSQILAHSTIGRTALDWIGPGATLVFHAAFMKPGRIGSPTALHQDQGLWERSYPGALTIWTALSPCMRANGCLIGYRGSHHQGPIAHQELEGYPWHAAIRADYFGNEEPVAYELQPGQAVAWHPYFAHASAENQSALDRRGMVAVFADASHPGFSARDSFRLVEMQRLAKASIATTLASGANR